LTTYYEAITENLTAGQTSVVGLGTTLAESGTASQTYATKLGVTIHAAMTASTTQARTYVGGGVVSETGKLHDAPAVQGVYGVAYAEKATLTGALNASLALRMLASALASSTLSGGQATTIREAAKAMARFSTQATYHLAITEVSDAYGELARYVGALMSESAQAHATLAPQYVGLGVINESGVFTSFLYEKMVFRLAITDDVTATDTLTPTTIYDAVIQENLTASVAYLSTNDSTTTWVMNTRTNALSEYRNWNFNSFASIGRKYIAANANGLYELNGARDVTTNIVADIAGGMVQFNDSKFTGLKGVYIGMNNQGEYFLKLTAGDGRYYMYQFTTNPNLMTSKVLIGKGLRSRYFQWELISTGPDFDLDSIEFIPMASDRRV
jgi:hypothetical protein